MELLNKYQNGNATVEIYQDGTRIIEWDDNEELTLDFPLNIDIRLMTKCDFGFNPTTGKSVCSFCHESARTDGVECDYTSLLEVLVGANLPKGMELAIGMNDLTPALQGFLQSCKAHGWIVNGTINQGALSKRGNQRILRTLIENRLLHGVGVSYRPKMPKMPKWLLDYDNTVVHTIAGIDDFEEVKKLADQGVKKILVLGEKNFGFNRGKVDLTSQSHVTWRTRVMKLTEVFDVVSFDNLALYQLQIKDKLKPEHWEEFYQGEHSFYINAVDKYFAPSSRSSLYIKKFGEISLRDYFKFLENQTINIKDE